MSAQRATGGVEPAVALPALALGQEVWAHSHRLADHGWQPVRERAIVLDPCVRNDPDYAGMVEIKIGEVINRVFVARNSLDVIEALPGGGHADV